MANIDVTVDIDIEDYLDEVDDQDLADELSSRGWFVGETKDWSPPNEELTYEEINVILELFQMALPGTIRYEIYEKLRKR
jgi:hypothetical protein